MNAIKLISAEAKKIQKDHPRLSWQDCIRQASQIYKLKKRKISGVKTRATKSAPSKPSKIKSRGSYTVKSALSSEMQSIAGILKRKRTKKAATPKMKAVKRKPATRRGTHTDTKSHNVNIKVMSGIDLNWLNQLNNTVQKINEKERQLQDSLMWYKHIKSDKTLPAGRRERATIYKKNATILKREITALKRHLTAIKKHIK